MRRLSTLLIPIALLAAAAVPAALAVTQTKTTIYQAFKSNGTPAISVGKTVHGTCMSGAEATDRSDAWRCMGGNFIYDPCFSSSKAPGIVLCPAAPWKSSGIELKYSGHLSGGHKGKASTSRLPWGIQTTTGLKCAFAGGATNAIGGHRENYFCTTGHEALWGSPSRSSQPWTILIAAASGAKKLTKHVGIAVAWF